MIANFYELFQIFNGIWVFGMARTVLRGKKKRAEARCGVVVVVADDDEDDDDDDESASPPFRPRRHPGLSPSFEHPATQTRACRRQPQHHVYLTHHYP